MEQNKTCKVDFKKRGKKIIMKQTGFCDDKQPNIPINKETEFLDFDKLEEIA